MKIHIGEIWRYIHFHLTFQKRQRHTLDNIYVFIYTRYKSAEKFIQEFPLWFHGAMWNLSSLNLGLGINNPQSNLQHPLRAFDPIWVRLFPTVDLLLKLREWSVLQNPKLARCQNRPTAHIHTLNAGYNPPIFYASGVNLSFSNKYLFNPRQRAWIRYMLNTHGPWNAKERYATYLVRILTANIVSGADLLQGCGRSLILQWSAPECADVLGTTAPRPRGQKLRGQKLRRKKKKSVFKKVRISIRTGVSAE